jgi:hypothetical protein
MLGIHHETVKRIRHNDFNLPKVNFSWVPRALNRSQKVIRVQVFRGLLDFLESPTNRSLPKACTGDETWVYPDNSPTSMWIGADVTRLTRVRRTVASKNGMFWINFLNARYWCSDNAATVLPSIVEDRALSRPKLKASVTFLRVDSA